MVAGYFALLILIARITGRNSDNETFFTGKKSSPWYVVAFGMIGASLSGVTFISVPGWVATSQFSYMQMVFGYFAGYMVIIGVLLPLYYRLNLTTIYGYLKDRFGVRTYKTGASFFILSRVLGASFRLFLVANVLQYAVFEPMGVPFWVTVAVTILLIWVYTFQGGIKTIVYTDTLQTLFMLLSVGVTLYLLKGILVPEGETLITYLGELDTTQVFFFDDWGDSKHFFKNFFSGMFITLAMTGLDQDMMQKNLTCKNTGEAQKNMFWFSVILIGVNAVFLALGAMLYQYADTFGMDSVGDELFPAIALNAGLGPWVGIFFIIGLIAAAYSSADSALTSLTTSFSVDILEVDQMKVNQMKVDPSENSGEVSNDEDSGKPERIRKVTHIGFSVLLFFVIIWFKSSLDESVIKELFIAAGYTYGPLLGLYGFGLFSRRMVRDRWVPWVAIASPIICYVLKANSEAWFGYAFGFELLIVNGLLTGLGLWAISYRSIE
ncbi:MAG: sodium:solute symporter [Schleiferiaceae bacterium]